MARARDVIAYILAQYPSPLDLTMSKLVNILYLIDWRSAIVRGSQVTDLQWEAQASGPTCPLPGVLPVRQMDDDRPRLTTRRRPARALVLEWLQERFKKDLSVSLTPEDREIIDFVLRTAASKQLGPFTQLVNSTFPMRRVNEGQIDLVELAAQYRGEDSPVLQHG